MNDIVLTACIVVFIVDLSGIVDTIKGIVGRTLHRKVTRLKPLDCSLCMTFWTGLVVLLCEGAFTFPMVAWVCLWAFLTPVVKGVMQYLSDVLIALLNRLEDRL